MDYNGGAAIASGLIAGVAMAAILYLGVAFAPRQMRLDLFHMLGTLIAPRAGADWVYPLGAIVHAFLSLATALLYTIFFLPFADGSNVVGWGLLYGFVHYVIMGVNLEAMGYIHPLMQAREVPRPGAFAMNFPRATGAGFLAVHVVYGLMIGGLYTAFN